MKWRWVGRDWVEGVGGMDRGDAGAGGGSRCFGPTPLVGLAEACSHESGPLNTERGPLRAAPLNVISGQEFVSHRLPQGA